MEITREFLIIVAILFLFFSLILLLTLRYIKKKSELGLKERYDFEKHMVELEYFRKNMEFQLYDVSRKLEQDEKRWKDMNHLIISSQNRFEEKNIVKSEIYPNNFLKNFGIVHQNDFIVDQRLVFVLTPFNDNYRETFLSVKKASSNLNFNCIRGDEEYIPNEIFPSILRQIVKSRLIIANITGRNPNVLYELGITHALGKPTIIIAEDFTDIPFDLNNKRVIIYKTLSELEDKLEKSIYDMLINKEL